MIYEELSATAKRRLKTSCICPLCQDIIMPSDSIQLVKYRSGRGVNYTFFHTACLEKSRQQVKRV